MTRRSPNTPSLGYRCGECGWSSVKWVGRCGECQAWGSVAEVAAPTSRQSGARLEPSQALPISSVRAEAAVRQLSGIAEFDRVLGGGIVSGAVLLLAGPPGVGKSTLLLALAARAAERRAKTLYVSGEESAAQVRLRAERIGAVADEIHLVAEVDLAAVLAHIDAVQPDLLVIDSVQTVVDGGIAGVAGGVTQVRAVASELVREAKARHLPTLLVGHVTKDGGVAGPRALEHIVDVVLQLEGERDTRLRVLRAVKNRFGPVDEIGCFDLTEGGIREVADATGLFVSQHREPVSGTCVTVTLEGRRPLLAEVQSLVTGCSGPSPRRAVSGLDSARLAMLLAVLQRRVDLRLAPYDIYAATVGGARLRGPSTDLAVAVSLASAALDVVVPAGAIAVGEVGLAGELRRVPDIEQRLREAARLGFGYAVVPCDHGPAPSHVPSVDGLTVVESSDLCRALHVLGVIGGRPLQLPPDLRVVG